MIIHSQHGTHGVVLGESPAGRCYGDYGVVSVMWWVTERSMDRLQLVGKRGIEESASFEFSDG